MLQLRPAFSLVALLLAACGGGGSGSGSSGGSAPPPSVPPPSPPPPPAVTATLTSSAATVEYGAAVTLTFSSANSASCQLWSNAAGSSSLPLSFNGSRPARIYANTTFTYTCTGTTAGTSAAQSVSVAMSTPALTFKMSENAVNDAAWEPHRGVLYLAFGALAKVAPNSLAAFDPVTGTLLATAYAGSEPNAIAVSEDGHYLYVAFRTSSTVSRFSLPGLTRDFTVPIPLGTNDLCCSSFIDSPAFATDIAVAPGASQKFAVSLYVPQSPLYSSSESFIAFDGQTRLSGVTGIYSFGTYLAWTGPDTLVGLHGLTQQTELGRYDTSGGSVVSLGSTDVANQDANTIVYRAGRIYTGCGQVIDATSGQALASFARPCITFPTTRPQVAPDLPNNRAYFGDMVEDPSDSTSGYVLSAYREDTRERQYSARIPMDIDTQIRGQMRSMTRWGVDGLAIVSNAGQLIIVNGPFVAPGGGAVVGTIPGTQEPRWLTGTTEFSTLLPQVVDADWDPLRARLYASIPANAADHAGQIAIIDPLDLSTVSYVTPASPAQGLDVTDDGQFLYAAEEDSFQRFSLPAFSSNLIVQAPGQGSRIEAAPGAPHTVALGGAVFVDAVNLGYAYGGRTHWGQTADSLFAVDSDGSGFEIRSWQVGASGLTQTDQVSRVFSSVHPFPFYAGYAQSGGLLYADTGVVYDPVSHVVTGILPIGPATGLGVLSGQGALFATPAWGPVAIDAVHHRAYFAACIGVTNEDSCDNYLVTFDTSNYAAISSWPVQMKGRARRFLHVNGTDFAMVAYDGRLVYFRNPAALND